MPRTAKIKAAEKACNDVEPAEEIVEMMDPNEGFESDEYSGLFLAGRVAKRTRRLVPKDKPRSEQTEIVTYTIDDSASHRYYVDDYAPENYFSLDEYINIPVYVKPYRKKNGVDLSYTLSVKKDRVSVQGEEF